MTLSKYLKISYLGDDFKQHFKGKINPKKFKFSTKTLGKWMTDQEIISELKPQEVTLSEFAYFLKNGNPLTNGYANIAYIKDGEGTLWAVDASWYSGGWNFDADSVEGPRRWRGGRQVLSRDSFGSKTLSSSDTLPDEIILNGIKYRKV